MKYRALRTLLLLGAIFTTSVTMIAQPDASLEKNSQNPLLNKYSDYEAVILADYGEIEFVKNHGGGFDFALTRKTHYKINTTSGLDWSEIEIPLYIGKTDRETLRDLSATVINPEDHSVINYKMAQLDIFTEKRSKNVEVKKFAVPQAREGSIIEVKYTCISPYLFNLEDWIFQYSIPVLYSQIKVSVIPFYEYALLKRGSKPIDSFYKTDAREIKELGVVKYRERTYVYIMLDVPAFDDDSYITNKADYISRLEFQLSQVTQANGIKTPIMTDWPSVNKELLSHANFGKYANSAARHSKKSAQVYPLLHPDPEARANAITAYVKQNIKWDARSRKFTTESPKKVIETREGNSAEINLYLVGMLKAAGLDAFPILLSTRAHGKVYRDVPMHKNFNYVVAGINIESGPIIRDATDPHYPDDKLPIRCLNGSGLVVQKESDKWIHLGTGAMESQIKHTVRLEFPENEENLKSTVNITSTGYDAIKQMKKTGNDPKEAKNLFSNDLITDIDSIVLNKGQVREDSFSVDFFAAFPKESIGKHLFIHPFADLAEKECLLNKKTRAYPVDMIYKRSNLFSSVITIPEGYKPSFVPKRYNVSNNLMTVRYIPELKGNVLTIDAELSFHQRTYQPKDYKKLRYFYTDMVERLNEIIILEQIEQVIP